MKKAPAVAAPSSLDRFKVETVKRSQLQNAPYNPRVITEVERRKLRAVIEKHGYVEPPVWNRRTGNLVGGHQRLAIRDSMMKTRDYELQVAVIDVSELEEKELNVALNNPEAQGAWDLEKLAVLFKEDKIEPEGAGFDMADVYRLFGDSPARDSAALDKVADDIRLRQQQHDAMIERNKARDDDEFYMIVVFRDGQDRADFLEALKLDDNRFQDGRVLRRLYLEGRADGEAPKVAEPPPTTAKEPKARPSRR